MQWHYPRAPGVGTATSRKGATTERESQPEGGHSMGGTLLGH